MAPSQDSFPRTYKKIRSIVLVLKNNKASGEDGVIAEMLKIRGELLTDRQQAIVANIRKNGIIPEVLKTALIHPLYITDDINLNNYRVISLLPTAYNVVSRALLTRMEQLT